MKKTILCLLLLATILSLTACARTAHTEPPADLPQQTNWITLDVTIEKVYDDTLYVRTADETGTYFFVDRCDHVTKDGEPITDGDLSIGDGIRIVYDSNTVVGDSPSQITNVFEIKLISTLQEQ